MNLRLRVSTLLLALTLPAFAQDYKMTLIPKLNGLDTNGFSMNASGQIVGAAPVPGGGSRNFLWSRQGGMVDITGPTPFSIRNMNASGLIAGGADVNGYQHAAILAPGGGLQDLGTLGGNSSDAMSINDQGQVAGCSDTPTSRPDYQNAFVWSASSGMQDLGDGTNSLACGGWTSIIGNGGQVAGILSNNDVFLWTADQGVQDLGFPGLARAVNDTGAIVGWPCCGLPNAFLWTPSGGLEILDPPTGFDHSFASAINNHGQIVGALTTGIPGGTRAFIWSRATGMKVLPPTVPKWQALAINDAGQILVERGGTDTRLLTPLMKVTLTSSGNPSRVGQAVTFTAVVASVQGAPPEGENIVFKDGSKVLATVPLGSGSASFSTSSLKAGTHTIIANYVGDVNYFSSRSAVLKQVVTH